MGTNGKTMAPNGSSHSPAQGPARPESRERPRREFKAWYYSYREAGRARCSHGRDGQWLPSWAALQVASVWRKDCCPDGKPHRLRT